MDKLMIDPDITEERLEVPQDYPEIEPLTGPPPPSPPNITIERPVEERSVEKPIDNLTDQQNIYIIEPVEFERPERTWSSWIMQVLILIAFLGFVIYFTIKYAFNESEYVIKKNAEGYKISLEEMKEDIKSGLRTLFDGWKDGIYAKMNKFFFQQHVENGTFKMTKYKIPKNLLSKKPDE
jgi:hypothetical protein